MLLFHLAILVLFPFPDKFLIAVPTPASADSPQDCHLSPKQKVLAPRVSQARVRASFVPSGPRILLLLEFVPAGIFSLLRGAPHIEGPRTSEEQIHPG